MICGKGHAVILSREISFPSGWYGLVPALQLKNYLLRMIFVEFPAGNSNFLFIWPENSEK